MAPKSLHPIDWTIFVFMLVGTLGIGVYHAYAGGRQRTTSEYLTGNRKINSVAASVSLVTSFFSAILILGIPAEGYLYGGSFWLMAVGLSLGCILAALVFVPVFHPLHLTSVNQYLKLRYNSRFVQIIGTLSGLISMFLYSAIIFFAPATSIQAVTAFPTWASILIGCLVAIIYTTIGGINAVIWTDVFQGLLMFTGLLAITMRGIAVAGGISEVWATCSDWGRLDMINLDPDPTVRLTFWSLVVGAAFNNLAKFGTSQTAVQRYCSTPSVTKARLLVLGVVPLSVVVIFLAVLSGLAMFTFFVKEGCDPLSGGFVRNPNQLIPHFLAVAMDYPGVQGILLASLASASFSTASSTLNSSSAIIWEDVLKVIWSNLPEKRNLLITKALVVLCGAVSMALSFGVSQLRGTVIRMAVTFMSACAGPTTAMFLLGIFVPVTTWVGSASGAIVGFIFALWVSFGGYSIKQHNLFLTTTTANCSHYAATYHVTPIRKVSPISAVPVATTRSSSNLLVGLYSISYLWIALFSILVAMFVGVIVSLLTTCLFTGWKDREVVPSHLLHPWLKLCSKRNDDKVKDAQDGSKFGDVLVMTEEKEEGTDIGYDNIVFNTKL